MIFKKCSAYIYINVLIQASRIIVRVNPVFETYFNKKKQEGKCYNGCINHVAKKLIRIIHHLLKNNCDYKIVNN